MSGPGAPLDDADVAFFVPSRHAIFCLAALAVTKFAQSKTLFTDGL